VVAIVRKLVMLHKPWRRSKSNDDAGTAMLARRCRHGDAGMGDAGMEDAGERLTFSFPYAKSVSPDTGGRPVIETLRLQQ
jgi:hypothetical protein